MKYLLVLAVILVAIYIWRNNRLRSDDDKPARKAPRSNKLAPPTVMVACRHCGTHLPEAEAVKGRQGTYCSDEHLRLGERGPE
ncbi:PP0621 family protein [Hydrogenophaga sp.]|uniref:PP0621 family protein n=1 Tax=Hydrogenophaga sp. TaxID=1904254 RepID=UPI0027202F7C|nr:PP0621 family protein [Hydrogenophaga sp.]MDO8904171.1 PP0621 family protein [Hydrogenophaga sp.]